MSDGVKEISTVIGGHFSSMTDLNHKGAVRKFLEKHPAGTKLFISYEVYGYGDNEKFDADKEEAAYLEKLMKQEPHTFKENSKQLGSGELTEVIREV